MAAKEKHFEGGGEPGAPRGLQAMASESQLDFEIRFLQGLMRRHPHYVDVLRLLGHHLTQKRRYREGLQIDSRLVQLRPRDPVAHYNLACSYALLGQTDEAIEALRRAIELGYRDFKHLKQDRDLDSIRNDPRFRQLLRHYGVRS